MSKTEQKLHFSIDGEHLTQFFRQRILDGDSAKVMVDFQDSICGGALTPDHVRSILKGEQKLVGVNTLSLKKDKPLSEQYMQDLCYVYRKTGFVPGLWEARELKKWMDKIPEGDKRTEAEITRDDLDEADIREEAITVVNAAAHRRFNKQGGVLPSDFGPSTDPLAYIHKIFMEPPLDVSKAATGLPEPHVLSPDDWNHYTWTICPEGNLYKIPYQEHGSWFNHYAEFIPNNHLIFDEYGEGDPTNHGWIRISGGAGLGMTIRLVQHVPSNIRALTKFIYQNAAHQFSFDLSETNILELGIDYKRVLRLINQHYRPTAQ